MVEVIAMSIHIKRDGAMPGENYDKHTCGSTHLLVYPGSYIVQWQDQIFLSVY